MCSWVQMPVEVKSIITPRSWSSWRLWASWNLSSGPLQEHTLNYVQCLLHSLSTPSEVRAHRFGSATGQQDLGDAVSALMLGLHVCASASSFYTGSSECVWVRSWQALSPQSSLSNLFRCFTSLLSTWLVQFVSMFTPLLPW